MFDILFSRPFTIAKYRSAPLLKERLDYLAHCEHVGIKPDTLQKIAAHQLNIMRILDLQDGDGSDLHSIEGLVRRWSVLVDCKPPSKDFRRFVCHAERWMYFMGWLNRPDTVMHSHSREVSTFVQRMDSEHGWAKATIEGHRRTIDRFFVWIDKAGIDLVSVEITVVDQFIAHLHAHGLNRSTIQLYAQQLRGFFRFAEQLHWCQSGLADGIMPPPRYPNELIPKGLNRDEVIRLLATTEGDSPFDIRARAILALLITYGLRSSEVSGLQLDDLDWEQEFLRVRCPKPGRTHLYPLARDVGQAILRYLREVRPVHGNRNLFLSMKAPIKPLTRGVIKCIVSSRIDQLGITGKRRGPHSLRHATAQHLLDQGLSMKTVGDYLGHRSASTTSIYAKVKLDDLREVAAVDMEGLL